MHNFHLEGWGGMFIRFHAVPPLAQLGSGTCLFGIQHNLHSSEVARIDQPASGALVPLALDFVEDLFQEPRLQHIAIPHGADKPAYQVKLASKPAARSVWMTSAIPP